MTTHTRHYILRSSDAAKKGVLNAIFAAMGLERGVASTWSSWQDCNEHGVGASSGLVCSFMYPPSLEAELINRDNNVAITVPGRNGDMSLNYSEGDINAAWATVTWEANTRLHFDAPAALASHNSTNSLKFIQPFDPDRVLTTAQGLIGHSTEMYWAFQPDRNCYRETSPLQAAGNGDQVSFIDEAIRLSGVEHALGNKFYQTLEPTKRPTLRIPSGGSAYMEFRSSDYMAAKFYTAATQALCTVVARIRTTAAKGILFTGVGRDWWFLRWEQGSGAKFIVNDGGVDPSLSVIVNGIEYHDPDCDLMHQLLATGEWVTVVVEGVQSAHFGEGRLTLNTEDTTFNCAVDIEYIHCFNAGAFASALIPEYADFDRLKWLDLRSTGSPLHIGTAITDSVQHNGATTLNRTAAGITISGANWAPVAAFRCLEWDTSKERRTVKYVFTVSDAAFLMMGVGDDTITADVSYWEGKVFFYQLQAQSTRLWAGEFPTIGPNVSFALPSSITLTNGKTYRVEITGNGIHGGRVKLYELPSAADAHWDDTSNLIADIQIPADFSGANHSTDSLPKLTCHTSASPSTIVAVATEREAA